MMELRGQGGWFEKAGAALCVASLFLFMFALPPLQAGIWLQTENVVLAAFVLTGLGALWSAAGLVGGWLVPSRVHPVFAVLVVFVLWQMVAAAFAPSPWRAWFGPPESGEGVAWYVVLAVMSAMVAVLWARYARVLVLAAVVSVSLQAVLYLLCPLVNERYVPGSYRPSQWAAFLAFMVGYVWIAFSLAGKHRLRGWIGMGLVMAMSLIVSRNLSAMVVLGAPMLASFKALLFGRYRWWGHQLLGYRRVWRQGAIAACVLPLLWIAFSVHSQSFDLSGVAAMSQPDSSLSSRMMLNKMGVEAMQQEPARWVIGNGWGGFSDVVFKYALVDGIHVYADGQRRPNNLMVDGYSFHSHNQPLEALLALGLPGLLLWLAIPCAVIATVKREQFWVVVPMVVGLVWLDNVWYELMHCVPFHALALGAICQSRKGEARMRGMALCYGLVGVLMLVSASGQKQAMHYGQRLREAAHALPYEDYPLSWVESDLVRGGDRLRSSQQFFASWLEYKLRKGSLDDNDRAWYAMFLEAAHDAARSKHVGANVASMELELAYGVIANFQSSNVMEPLVHAAGQGMPEIVTQCLRVAPLRDEKATPYLVQIHKLVPPEEALPLVNDMLVVSASHRGALWVSGAMLAEMAGHGDEGRERQKLAVGLHVEDVYPVTDEELAPFK